MAAENFVRDYLDRLANLLPKLDADAITRSIEWIYPGKKKGHH